MVKYKKVLAYILVIAMIVGVLSNNYVSKVKASDANTLETEANEDSKGIKWELVSNDEKNPVVQNGNTYEFTDVNRNNNVAASITFKATAKESTTVGYMLSIKSEYNYVISGVAMVIDLDGSSIYGISKNTTEYKSFNISAGEHTVTFHYYSTTYMASKATFKLYPVKKCKNHKWVSVDTLGASNNETYHYCEYCGYAEVHGKLKETTAQEPGCITSGDKKISCDICDYEKHEEIKSIGHKYKLKSGVDATCTTTGSGIYACVNCGDEKENIVSPTGHNWVLKKVYIKDGIKKKLLYCTNCKETQEVEIDEHKNGSYILNDDSKSYTYSLTQYDFLEDTLTIPEYYNDLPVTKIENGDMETEVEGYNHGDNLKHLYISDNVEELGENTFNNCYKLESIHLGNNVKILDDNCFNGVGNGTKDGAEINIPSSLTTIGKLNYCHFKKLNTNNVCGQLNFTSVVIDNLIINKNIDSIEFIGCNIKDNFEFTDGADIIMNYGAMTGCTVPKYLYIPYRCVLDNGSLNFTGAEKVKIDGRCEDYNYLNIGMYPTQLKELILGDNLYTKQNSAGCDLRYDAGYGVEKITTGKNINHFADYSISYCSKLESLDILTDKVVVLDYGFDSGGSSNANKQNLRHFAIPNTAGIITGMYSLCGLTLLDEGLDPEKFIYMGDGAFSGCDSTVFKFTEDGVLNFTSLVCSDYSVTPFYDSNISAYEVKLNDNLPSLDLRIFMNINMYKFKVPSRVRRLKIGSDNLKICNFIYDTREVPIEFYNEKLTDEYYEKLYKGILGDKVYEFISNEDKYQEFRLYYLAKPTSYESSVSWSYGAFTGMLQDIVYYPHEKSKYSSDAFTLRSLSSVRSFSVDNVDFALPLLGNSNPVTVAEFGEHITSLPEEAFKGRTNFTTLKGCKGITQLGDNSFSGCTALKELPSMPNIKSIGNSAFNGCSALKTVNSMPKLEVLGSYAFSGCSSLESIDLKNTSLTSISSSCFAGALVNPTLNVKIELPATLKQLDSTVFAGCSGITEFHTGGVETLTGMSPSVIMSNLKKLYLDDSLVSYTVSGPSSPYGQGLDYVYVGKNLENIGDSNISAFNAKEIECSDDLKVLPSKAFEYLNDCKFHLPKNLITIGSEAFKASNLTSINLPNKLQTIASNAFQGSKLVKLELPASLNTLSDSAFDSCIDLVSVKMDNVIATENLDLKALRLGENTFSNCTKLEKVELPNQIRNLGANTFKDDTSLNTLYLGTELDTVDETAFDGCSALSSVYCYRYTKYNKPYMTELKEDVDNNTFKDCPSDIHFIEVYRVDYSLNNDDTEYTSEVLEYDTDYSVKKFNNENKGLQIVGWGYSPKSLSKITINDKINNIVDEYCNDTVLYAKYGLNLPINISGDFTKASAVLYDKENNIISSNYKLKGNSVIPINKADIGDAVLALTVDDITEYYNVEISEDNLSELKNNGFSFKYASVNIDANTDIDLPDDKVDDTDIADITTQSAINKKSGKTRMGIRILNKNNKYISYVRTQIKQTAKVENSIKNSGKVEQNSSKNIGVLERNNTLELNNNLKNNKKANRLKEYKENFTDEYLENNNIVTTEESVNKEDNKVKNISLRNKIKKKIVAKSNKVTVISGNSKVRILKNGYIRTKKKGEVKLKVINKKQVYYIVLHIK